MTRRELDNLVNRIGKRIDKITATFGPASEETHKIAARVVTSLPFDAFEIDMKRRFDPIHLKRQGGRVTDSGYVAKLQELEQWLKTEMNLTTLKRQARQTAEPFIGKTKDRDFDYAGFSKLYFEAINGAGLTNIIQYMYDFEDVSAHAVKVRRIGQRKGKKTRAEVGEILHEAKLALDDVRAYNASEISYGLANKKDYSKTVKHFDRRLNEKIEGVFWAAREIFNQD